MEPRTRRQFVRDLVCGTVGVGVASWWNAGRMVLPTSVAADVDAPSAERRAKELGLEIPKPASNASLIVPAVRSGNLLFVSGHIPKDAEGKPIVGKVGAELTTKQATEAARNIALTILGVVRSEASSLDNVVRLVKVLGMVNCTPDYIESPQVINGFSQVLIDVFGEKAGKGARSAVGMASLPLGVPVEVEAIFEIRG